MGRKMFNERISGSMLSAVIMLEIAAFTISNHIHVSFSRSGKNKNLKELLNMKTE